MFVVENLLPVYDKKGKRFSKKSFGRVHSELSERFGGVTGFLQAPAFGLWRDDDGEMHRDEIVVFEVMSDELDRRWRQSYRKQLEKQFKQYEIVVRASSTDRL